MKVLFFGVVLMIFFVNVRAQMPTFGKCPNLQAKQNFDIAQYLGLWYENQKYFTIFQACGKCVTAQYSINNDGTVKVVNKQRNSITNNESVVEGTARPAGNPTEGKLTVTFPSSKFSTTGDYWILDTDYSNYAVIFSCSEYAFIHTEFLWILTRERTPYESVLNTAYAVIEKNNLRTKLLKKTTQNNCP